MPLGGVDGLPPSPAVGIVVKAGGSKCGVVLRHGLKPVDQAAALGCEVPEILAKQGDPPLAGVGAEEVAFIDVMKGRGLWLLPKRGGGVGP